MTLTIEPLLVDGLRRGVPYGSRARLILIYLQTEAVKTRSRTVELGASMRNWLGRMGIPTGGKNYKDVMEQARRIEGSIVSFTWHGDDGTARWRDTIVRGRFEPLSDEADPRQGRLFVDTVELSETFYEALLRHPAPIHEAALRHIANKSAVIDVYLWLAYRLHILEQPVNVSWSALQAQFGSELPAPLGLQAPLRRDPRAGARGLPAGAGEGRGARHAAAPVAGARPPPSRGLSAGRRAAAR